MEMFEQLREVLTDTLSQLDEENIEDIVRDTCDDFNQKKFELLYEKMVVHMQDSLQGLKE